MSKCSNLCTRVATHCRERDGIDDVVAQILDRNQQTLTERGGSKPALWVGPSSMGELDLTIGAMQDINKGLGYRSVVLWRLSEKLLMLGHDVNTCARCRIPLPSH